MATPALPVHEEPRVLNITKPTRQSPCSSQVASKSLHRPSSFKTVHLPPFSTFRAGTRASPQLHYSPDPPRKKKLPTIHRSRPRSRQQGEPGRARSRNRLLESRSIFRSRLHQLRPPCRSRSHLTVLPRTRIPANPGGGRGFSSLQVSITVENLRKNSRTVLKQRTKSSHVLQLPDERL